MCTTIPYCIKREYYVPYVPLLCIEQNCLKRKKELILYYIVLYIYICIYIYSERYVCMYITIPYYI